MSWAAQQGKKFAAPNEFGMTGASAPPSCPQPCSLTLGTWPGCSTLTNAELGPGWLHPEFCESGTHHSDPGKLQRGTPGHRAREHAGDVVEDRISFSGALSLLPLNHMGQQRSEPRHPCPPSPLLSEAALLRLRHHLFANLSERGRAQRPVQLTRLGW